MIHFIISDADTRYLWLKGDDIDDDNLIKKFEKNCNLVDPVCYLPSWGNRPEMTQDFVFEYVQQSGKKIYYCSVGLWQEAYKFFKYNNGKFTGLIENQKYFKQPIKHSFEEFKEIVISWNLKYEPRPYQYEAAYNILTWKSSLSELATRAGKTLLVYLVFRYAIEYMGMKRILMIVPSISLVKQGYDDFSTYGEFFKTECIWGGGKLVESANLTIGTFQSLIGFLDKKSKKYNPKFFDGYDCVCVDETHRATAAQIKTIISQPFMMNVKIKFGVTGTLPKEHTIPYYCLHALLGAKIQTVTPKELMDEGYISKIKINQIRLHYTDIEKQRKLFIKCANYTLSEFVTEPKLLKTGKTKQEKIMLEHPEHQLMYVKKMVPAVQMVYDDMKVKYTDINDFDKNYCKALKPIIKNSNSSNMLVIERYMAHFMNERKEYLYNKILSVCDKNTLILAHHTEYITEIYNDLVERFPHRHVAKITGAITAKKREEIKQLMKDNNDVILIASYGTSSTGLTFANLHFGILFESFKSNVINMQSLGRGLGLGDNKSEYTVYDMIDCFNAKEISNKIYLQGVAKTKIYKEQSYPYNIINVNV